MCNNDLKKSLKTNVEFSSGFCQTRKDKTCKTSQEFIWDPRNLNFGHTDFWRKLKYVLKWLKGERLYKTKTKSLAK